MSTTLYQKNGLTLTRFAREGELAYALDLSPSNGKILSDEELLDFCIEAVRALADKDPGILLHLAGEVTTRR